MLRVVSSPLGRTAGVDPGLQVSFPHTQYADQDSAVALYKTDRQAPSLLPFPA